MKKRMFRRIAFATEGELKVNGACHKTTIVDLSLRGAQVSLHEGLSLQPGLPCSLTIHLDESRVKLPFQGIIIHACDTGAGIRFTGADVATMMHLRRLLELNTGDAEWVAGELHSFIQIP